MRILQSKRTSLVRLFILAVSLHWTREIPAQTKTLSATNPTNTIPALRGPDGRYTHEGLNFSSRRYENEAVSLMIREADIIAVALNLDEALPITRSNIASAFAAGYGRSEAFSRPLGAIHTTNYGYYFAFDHKLSSIMRERQTQECLEWRRTAQRPLSELDTNAAYVLAVQWLAAASVNLEQLNNDAEVRVEIDPFWNRRRTGRLKDETFVPIYDVVWVPPLPARKTKPDLALVTLFAPTRTLLNLCVRDARYLERPSLTFTNLEALLH